MTEIQELREIVQAQAKRLMDTRAIAQLNECRDEQIQERVRTLENALADTRRDYELLTRLAVRMGRDLENMAHRYDGLVPFNSADPGPPHEPINSGWSYTVIGQRQRDAELREAEGEPPDAGMLEGIQ